MDRREHLTLVADWQLAASVRAAAALEQRTVSMWLRLAAQQRLRQQQLRAAPDSPEPEAA